MCNEIDPAFYGDVSPQRKYWFIWGIENMLKGMGANEYYFNVPAHDHEYRKVVETFGAVPTSLKPEIRYKKNL